MPQSVLVVDDDASLAENLAELVGTLGSETAIASTGRQALESAAQRPFDLALVDLRLPDGSGTELIDQLRVVSPHTQIVLITGDATIESALEAVHRGAFAYVLKPFSPPELLDTVRRALAQVELQRERERLRVDLERSERQHRQVVEAVPAFVLALDREGRIVMWNRRLEEATGSLRDEMIGRPFADVVGLGDPSGRPRPLKIRDGRERLVRWETAAVDSDQGRLTYAVGIDVTAAEEAHLRARRAERLAAVGTMAAGLAHEVRNPLNSAVLQLTVLERRLAKGDATPASIAPVAAIVRDELERLQRLVGDFLAFAQPRPLDAKPTDVNDLCSGVVTLLAPEVEAAEVHTAVELAAGGATVLGDGERLRQVLINLLRNATEAGGDQITVRSRVLDGSVEIDIEDNGPGFPEEVPVFDAFFTTKPHGTGLGLSIVHRIIADHGGTIRVRSRPGATCFTLSLPR